MQFWSLYLETLKSAAATGDIVAANHLDVALGSFETQLGQMRIALEKRREQPGYAAECATELRESPSRFREYATEPDKPAARFEGAQRALF